MTQHATDNYYKISLPADIAKPLVELGLAEWELAEERSATEVVDLAIAVGSSLGPAATVAVSKTVAGAVSRRIVQILAEKWRARRGETRLTVDLRRRQGQMSLRVEIAGESDGEAAAQILRALADAAPRGS